MDYIKSMKNPNMGIIILYIHNNDSTNDMT